MATVLGIIALNGPSGPISRTDVNVRVSLHPDSTHDTPNQNAGVPVGGGPNFPHVSTEDS